MGGGDLNMKKSWHPLLFTNQERVWKKEKEALAERKKLAELQKEQAQERAVQELMDLQAKAGGGKREQRVEWMYAAPAEGNGPNAEELEAYLLGKKRVDKLLQGNEEKMMAAPSTSAPGGSFTSIQNANSARDTAAKIREDPLLAIKRQEQAQYEKILKNPQRLKELRAAREAATPAPKKSKKDETKEERRARKDAKRGGKEDDGHGSKRSGRHDSRSRSRSPPPKRAHYDDHSRDSRGDKYERSRDGDDYRGRRYEEDDRLSSSHRPSSYDRPAPPRDYDRPPPPRDYERPPPPREYENSSSSRPQQRPVAADFNRPASYQRPPQPTEEEERLRKQAAEERLAAMQSSASTLAAERNARLAKLEAEDKQQLAKEVEARSNRGKGMAPSFLREQERKVFSGGMDLGERMKRSGRVGMVGDRE